MNIKTCFFPCAGLGTRMGPLGKELPKPLWPLFETTLVGAQMSYAKELGFSRFCVNSHHKADRLKSWVSQQNEDIENYFEEELLGSGGCFHNIKAHSKEIDDLYIFNPDSFLVMDSTDWKSFLGKAATTEQLLIAIPCHSEDPYNRLVLENNKLKKIVPPATGAPTYTYSGFGKVSLNGLDNSQGESGFFQSVAIPGDDGPEVFIPQKPYEFWDFGTADSYKENLYKLVKTKSLLRNFLEKAEIINKSNISIEGYKSFNGLIIDLKEDSHKKNNPHISIKIDNEFKRVD